MRRVKSAALAVSAVVVLHLVWVHAAPTQNAKKVVAVLSTSDLVGKTSPCGCHTPKGGLSRIASFVDSTRIRYGESVLVDAGDFSGAVEYENGNGPFIIEQMGRIGYDAITVGEREFTYGYALFKEQVKKLKVPVVLANLRDKATGNLVWKPYLIKNKQGTKVAIIGLISRTVPLGAAQDSTIVDDPVVTAQKLFPELRKKADVVVLLAHMGRVDAEDLASQVPGADVVVVGHHPGLVMTSRKVASTVSVASGEQGQNIGETLVDCESGKCAVRDGRVVTLLPEVGERADVQHDVKAFEDAVNAKQRKQQQDSAVALNTVQAGVAHYLGQEACVTCHEPQYEQWKTTAHSHAFDALVKVSKDATPECVQCHVTGFAKNGGFVSQASTGHLVNVQCEVCHGMGTDHDQFAKKSAAPPEAVCVACHDPQNDPSWNYAAKLPKVTH